MKNEKECGRWKFGSEEVKKCDDDSLPDDRKTTSPIASKAKKGKVGMQR